MSTKSIFTLMAMAIALASCSDDNSNEPDSGTGGSGSASSTTVVASIDELTSFSVAVDSTALSESETVPADNEDYIENNTFDDAITIAYNGESATIDNNVDGVEVTTEGAHVVVNSTVKLRINLSGSSSNGSLKVYGTKKVNLVFNGLNLHNPTGAAINNQCKKRTYCVLTDGTFNSLSDGTSYIKVDGEDMKGTLFSEGKLFFSGSGKLRVYANTKAGISCDDYILFRPDNDIYVKATAGNCIKANDSILVRGGVINVETSADGGKGLSCDGYIAMDGGRVTAITTGNAVWDDDDQDLKGPAGIKCDSLIVINGGALQLKSSGRGGKGMSADQDIVINGGTVKVITTGTRYVYGSEDTKSKGIKADGDLTINGGDILVRTTGGEGSEGIESKSVLTVNDGNIQVYAYDDAINSAGNLIINGGNIFAYATNNDGIDSNSALTINGGNVIACGTTQPEDGFDCDQNTFTITGGNVLGIGGGTSTPSAQTTTQPVAIVGGTNMSTGTYIGLTDSNGRALFGFKVPRAYNSYTLLLSANGLTKGGSCTVSSEVTISGGTDFDGFFTGCSISGGSMLANPTFSSIVTTVNYNGGMGGGGAPGGGGGPGGFPGGF